MLIFPVKFESKWKQFSLQTNAKLTGSGRYAWADSFKQTNGVTKSFQVHWIVSVIYCPIYQQLKGQFKVSMYIAKWNILSALLNVIFQQNIV